MWDRYEHTVGTVGRRAGALALSVLMREPVATAQTRPRSRLRRLQRLAMLGVVHRVALPWTKL